MIKYVKYCYASKLPCCGICNASVILCISTPELLANPDFPFVEASICECYTLSDLCAAARWTYKFSYESEVLVDPAVGITAADISGVFCEDCLTDWVQAQAPTISDSWLLLGNSNTEDGTNFIGTTNDVPVEMRVNNQRARKIFYDADAPVIVDGKSTNASSGVQAGTVISGGAGNTFTGTQVSGSTPLVGYGVLGGGSANSLISIDYSVVVGGQSNSIDATNVVATPDYYPTTQTNGCFIGAGLNNLISNEVGLVPETMYTVAGRVIGGGEGNYIKNSSWSTIAGGQNNGIDSSFSGTDSIVPYILCASIFNVISGGADNIIIGKGFADGPVVEYRNYCSVISGGRFNRIENGFCSTVGGGYDNRILCTTFDNSSEPPDTYSYRYEASVISGGLSNRITDTNESVIAGGTGNQIITSDGAVIGGGGGNVIQNSPGSDRSWNNGILSGSFNQLEDAASSVIVGGMALKLGSSSFGFQAGSTRSVFPVGPEIDVSAFSNIGFFSDVDLWIANTNGAAKKLKLIEPNTDVDFSSANYSSFEAPAQAANIEYILPAVAGSVGQSLKITNVAGTVVTLGWA